MLHGWLSRVLHQLYLSLMSMSAEPKVWQAYIILLVDVLQQRISYLCYTH